MQQSAKTNAAKGLDIGTSRIVVAEPNGSGYHYRGQLNAFVSLPLSKLTETGLQKEGVPYTVAEGDILVLGDRAERFARVFNGDLRRPMQNGLLNPAERQSLRVIEETVAGLCGAPKEGERICFSVPSPGLGGEASLTYHQSAVAEMLEQLGYYQPQAVNEGLAVVFAELEASNYSGIGISFGGGMCNCCLAYLGMPVFAFSTAKAGDFIDGSAARVTGETTTSIRQIKEESFALNGRGSTTVEQALSIYYDDMIQTVVAGLERELRNARRAPELGQAAPVVVAGGSATLNGFLPRLERALGKATLPIPISGVRLAPDPLHTTAKGALRAAILEM